MMMMMMRIDTMETLGGASVPEKVRVLWRGHKEGKPHHQDSQKPRRSSHNHPTHHLPRDLPHTHQPLPHHPAPFPLPIPIPTLIGCLPRITALRYGAGYSPPRFPRPSVDEKGSNSDGANKSRGGPCGGGGCDAPGALWVAHGVVDVALGPPPQPVEGAPARKHEIAGRIVKHPVKPPHPNHNRTYFSTKNHSRLQPWSQRPLPQLPAGVYERNLCVGGGGGRYRRAVERQEGCVCRHDDDTTDRKLRDVW